jgi:hypothetical protein
VIGADLPIDEGAHDIAELFVLGLEEASLKHVVAVLLCVGGDGRRVSPGQYDLG